MTSSTLLPGVDRYGAGYRVRISFPTIGRYTETGIATPELANARSLELGRLRAAGLTPNVGQVELTLREAAEGLLARKRTHVSRKTKRKLRASGVEWWERATRPWREGEFADVPVSLLSRVRLDDALTLRAADHPKTARDEHAGLTASLRFAELQGARVDPALFTIERLALTPRKRRALTVDELELLASCAPDYARRFVLLLGTTGCRIGELFTLTDDHVYLETGELFVGEESNKEGVDKWIALTAEEVVLLREQLGGLRAVDEESSTAGLPSRAAGTSLVFPTKTGRPWRHFQFLRLVFHKARRRAAVKYREQNGLAADAATPFDDLVPHDLRATAATLMRDAGFAREDAAARLGHADSGQLLDRIYDQGDRRVRTRRAIDALAPDGLRALADPGSRPASRQAASGTDDPRSVTP